MYGAHAAKQMTSLHLHEWIKNLIMIILLQLRDRYLWKKHSHWSRSGSVLKNTKINNKQNQKPTDTLSQNSVSPKIPNGVMKSNRL